MTDGIVASVRQRLLNHARGTNQEFNRVLTRFGIERFLYRLSRVSCGNRFMLKGGVLMLQMEIGENRHTRDVDFSVSGDMAADELKSVVSEACCVRCTEDGSAFDPDSVVVSTFHTPHGSRAYHVEFDGKLGSVRLRVRVDVALADAVAADPETLPLKALLDLPAGSFPFCPATTVIAEKTHAIVVLGMQNTRMKDYFDIHALATMSICGEELVRALTATFGRRRTKIPCDVPDGLTEEFERVEHKQQLWSVFLRRSVADPLDFGVVVARLRELLEPVFVAASAGRTLSQDWDPQAGWRDP